MRATALLAATIALAGCTSTTHAPQPSPPPPSGQPPSPTSTPSPLPTATAAALTTGVAVTCATAPIDVRDLTWTVRLGATVTVTAQRGSWTAALTGRPAANTALTGATVTISRNGHELSRTAMTVPHLAREVLPWDIGPTRGALQPLCIADFGGAAPTVLVGLWLGGAHCCTIVRALTPHLTGGATVLDRDLGNAGAQVATVDGHAVVISADTRFSYEFTDYGDSGLPAVVLVSRSGSLADTSRQFPALLRTDAQTWWTLQRTAPRPLGLLAAWTADECRIGECARAFITLAQLNSQHRLVGPEGWPTGQAYIDHLRAFLTAHGYVGS